MEDDIMQLIGEKQGAWYITAVIVCCMQVLPCHLLYCLMNAVYINKG
jgi:hypothetical protein